MYAIANLEQSLSQDRFVDTTWVKYFDSQAAIAAVAAHVKQLPSSRTPEQHTMKVYQSGLKYFTSWIGMRLPTADLMLAFIAHLTDRGLKANTISSKYLAPTRLYLLKLAGQRITGFTGSERDYVSDCREHMRAAAAVKAPRAETVSNIAPLWRADFKRLSVQQVNATLRAIDRTTLRGQRDYALLHVAFSTGLRIAELQRITLDSIGQEGDAILITVRGKRSNIDPVPISPAALEDIRAWVNAFNDRLDPDDPRRIAGAAPIWAPIVHGDNLPIVGVNGYTPEKGMTHQALRTIIAQRTAAALGESYTLAAHDTRRTAAAIAYDAGMQITDIQKLLRHKDPAVTMRYVGTKPTFDKSTLANYVTFG